MALGVPVLARDIPGNAALVNHGENGILYSTPAEAISIFEEAMDPNSSRLRKCALCARQRVGMLLTVVIGSPSRYIPHDLPFFISLD